MTKELTAAILSSSYTRMIALFELTKTPEDFLKVRKVYYDLYKSFINALDVLTIKKCQLSVEPFESFNSLEKLVKYQKLAFEVPSKYFSDAVTVALNINYSEVYDLIRNIKNDINNTKNIDSLISLCEKMMATFSKLLPLNIIGKCVLLIYKDLHQVPTSKCITWETLQNISRNFNDLRASLELFNKNNFFIKMGPDKVNFSSKIFGNTAIINSIEKKDEHKVEYKISQQNKQIEELEKELKKFQNDEKENETQIDTLKIELEHLNFQILQYQQILQKMEIEKVEVEKIIYENQLLNNYLQQLTQQLNQLQLDLNNKNQELENYKTENNQNKQIIEQLNTNSSQQQSFIEGLKKQISEPQNNSTDTDKEIQIETLKMSLEEQSQKVSSLNSQILQYQKIIQKMEIEKVKTEKVEDEKNEKDTILTESVEIKAPQLLFLSGGKFSVDVHGTVIEFDMPSFAIAPVTYQIEGVGEVNGKGGQKYELKVLMEDENDLVRDGTNLVKTIYVPKQFEGQKVNLPLQILDYNQTVTIVVQNNSMFKIEGFGWFDENRKRGDLFVTLKIV
ncbi:hypothetical protein EIN_507340 [Entamoeba invadens IP1]|uniref:Uncharacterized protein n=1 Tax=Entamoeba invadens IP1 TaxID=370355 RepID=A0A0A1UC69_ENTIV|nr:hypothetical protein EIN_507340 [Entamoeba invadens IP1]ELP92843.1 hypothetical protein EIN_507340 [Entamoeba invadens IP1]|eukprot:XP_004259614.1 hypothetical protein EIN_507340 [Entamoeba invadens IP1]